MKSDPRAEIQRLIAREAWKDAAAALEACRTDPPDVEWTALRAEVFAGTGDLDAAVTGYEHVLTVRPDHRGALYNLSLILSDLERHDDSMTTLESLIEVEGESASVLNDLAYEYIACEHYVPGYLAAMRAESLATDEGDRCPARLNAATALGNMGRRTEAVARLDAMLRDCTDVCGERGAARDLRESLEAERPQQSSQS